MAYGDVRICWNCQALRSEDDALFVDVERCPNCGALAAASPYQSGAATAAPDSESALRFGETGVYFGDTPLEF